MSTPRLYDVNSVKGRRPTLFEEPKSDATTYKTEAAIADLIKDAEYILPHLAANIGKLKKDLSYGTCHELVLKGPNERALIIHDSFVGALPVIGVCEDEAALSTAAVFIRAYDVVSRAIRQGMGCKRISKNTLDLLAKPSQPEVWSAMHMESVAKVPYRAAGLVARTALDLPASVLGLEAQGLPMHIAGLVDPLAPAPERDGPSIGFSALSGVIQKGR